MASFGNSWFIIITSEQAAKVRGNSTSFAALDPIALDDGRFFLPLEVLDDPAHAKHIPYLAALPMAKLFRTDSGALSVRWNSERPGDPSVLERPYLPSDPGNPLSSPPKLPELGDWSEAALYESVGRALTRWEAMEYELSNLFTAFLSPSMDSVLVARAYGSIATFNARLEMLKATAEAYFARYPKADAERGKRLKTAFANISDKVLDCNTQRNRIAHGMVGAFNSVAGPVRGVALLPAYYANKNRPLGTTHPDFAYTSGVIDYFGEQFWALRLPISNLAGEIHQFFLEESEAP